MTATLTRDTFRRYDLLVAYIAANYGVTLAFGGNGSTYGRGQKLVRLAARRFTRTFEDVLADVFEQVAQHVAREEGRSVESVRCEIRSQFGD